MTSVVYLALAVVFYRAHRQRGPEATLFAASFFSLGLASMVAHGTLIKLGTSWDLAAIILIISFFPFFRLATKFLRKTGLIVLAWLAYYVLIWYGFMLIPKGLFLYPILLVFALSVYDLTRTHAAGAWRSRDLRLALGIIFLSFGIYALDELRIVCDPHSWLQGHSLWHFGSAVSIFLYGRWHFAQKT
jgi:hypothetical protein